MCTGTGTIASSCSGIEYLGTTYDVSWILPSYPASPLPIFNPATAQTDAEAILDAINAALDTGGFVNIEYDTGSGTSSTPTCTGACYYVSYRINETTVSTLESRYNDTSGNWTPSASPFSKSHADQNLEATATFTPTIVPIPASLWLFGSGLFGLGAGKQPDRRERPQCRINAASGSIALS
jgi:hypothetical protein